MATIIQLRNDIASNWTSVNPILAEGEMGIETDTKKFKIGNGTTAWTSLPYFIDAMADHSILANRNIANQHTISAITDLQEALNSKVTGNASITGATKCKITYDAKGLVTAGSDLAASDIPDLSSVYQTIINDLSTIRSNATHGESAYTSQQTYGNIVTRNANEFATSAQGTLASTALQPADIVNNVATTATNKALSANMGKELNDRINNVESRGKYLSVWNCTTGLPETQPASLPYEYTTGDYYIVGTVGTTNYKPEGDEYTGESSLTEETEDVETNATYVYDGTQWTLLQGAIVEVTFASLAGQPTDNSNLASALNAKQNVIDNSNKLSADLINDTNSTNKFVTSADKTNWDGKLSGNASITGATKCKITYDSKGLVTAGADITVSDVTDITATAAELNILDGAEITTTELNYVDGVTSNIQSQINKKQDAFTTVKPLNLGIDVIGAPHNYTITGTTAIPTYQDDWYWSGRRINTGSSGGTEYWQLVNSNSSNPTNFNDLINPNTSYIEIPVNFSQLIEKVDNGEEQSTSATLSVGGQTEAYSGNVWIMGNLAGGVFTPIAFQRNDVSRWDTREFYLINGENVLETGSNYINYERIPDNGGANYETYDGQVTPYQIVNNLYFTYDGTKVNLLADSGSNDMRYHFGVNVKLSQKALMKKINCVRYFIKDTNINANKYPITTQVIYTGTNWSLANGIVSSFNMRLLHDNSTLKVNNSNQLYVDIQAAASSIQGFDATKTQTLKHVSGVLQWVDN